jgi:hypothetical protein
VFFFQAFSIVSVLEFWTDFDVSVLGFLVDVDFYLVIEIVTDSAIFVVRIDIEQETVASSRFDVDVVVFDEAIAIEILMVIWMVMVM